MNNIPIALIQYTCSKNIEQNTDKALELVRTAAEKGAKIIILPELFNTPYFCQSVNPEHFNLAITKDDEIFEPFSKTAADFEAVIVVPYFERRRAGIYHNSLQIFDIDGSRAGHYRKMHIPDDPGFYEKYYFTPGDDGFGVIETEYLNIGALICWDQWFPEAARLCALKGAQLLIYPTAIGTLPDEEDALKDNYRNAWQTIQRSHAIANGCFVAAVNRVGQEGSIRFWGKSFLAGPFGQDIAHADEKEVILHCEIDLRTIEQTRRTWPFYRDRRIDKYDGLNRRVIQDD